MELNIEVCTLHWEEEICNALEEMAFDLIIGSDLMYLEEFYRPLLYTLARYSSLSANSIVLSWEQRIPDQELKFMQLAKAIFSLDGPRLAGTNPITQNPVYVVQMTKANPPVE